MIDAMHFLLVMAVLLLLIAGWIVLKSNSQELSEKTNRRFADTAGINIDGKKAKQKVNRVNPVEKLFWRAGVNLNQSQLVGLIGLVILLAFIAAIYQGIVLALLVALFAVLMMYLWLWQRARSRIKAILVQLPLFLDQVLRALSTGRSMESALALAVSETPNPLQEIFARVLRANRLGEDLGEAIQEAADLYRVQELYLVSLAVRVNRTYGSSVRDMLGNIVKMIHDREAARRELRTMTGETRVTAWVLGLLPVLMAVYIMLMNPSYMLGMWQDSSGQVLLIAALVFQSIGALALWRMIKSI